MQATKQFYLPLPSVSSIPLGVVITSLLFLFMAQLVAHDMKEPEFVESTPFNPPIYEETMIETVKTEKMPEKPIVETPPEIPAPSNDSNIESDISYAEFKPSYDGNEGFGIKFSGMPLAQVQSQPRYPSRAIARNIEGFVDVKFDITKIGTTKNISVVRAQPEGYFENAAMNAVKRWRYRPKMEEGKAVAFPGMVQRISFQMER